MNSREEYIQHCSDVVAEFKKKCDRFKFTYLKNPHRAGLVVVFKLKSEKFRRIGVSFYSPREKHPFSTEIGLMKAIDSNRFVYETAPTDFPPGIKEFGTRILDREKGILAASSDARPPQTPSGGNVGIRKIGWLTSLLGRGN